MARPGRSPLPHHRSPPARSASDVALPEDDAVPRGFWEYRLQSVRYLRGDVLEHVALGHLSLHASGKDISGLASVPDHMLWRLDLARAEVSDEALDAIARFRDLEELVLDHAGVTADGLRVLHVLRKLHTLSIAHSTIGDDALVPIGALRDLQDLNLSFTNVTDEGLRELAFHPSLHVLNLRDSQVVGDRLAPLVTIETLELLCLDRRQAKHAKQFKKERPEVEVVA